MRFCTSKASAIECLMDVGDLVLMFKACNLVFKHDVATVRFLLPYIVHNALAHGSDAARESVRAEIEAVLRSGHASREGELCVQEVFSLLDALNKAVAEARAAAAPTPSGAPHSFEWPTFRAYHTSASACCPVLWCRWLHLFPWHQSSYIVFVLAAEREGIRSHRCQDP